MKKNQKQNLRLGEIKIKSFQTAQRLVSTETIKGGSEAGDTDEDFCSRAISSSSIAAAIYLP